VCAIFKLSFDFKFVIAGYSNKAFKRAIAS